MAGVPGEMMRQDLGSSAFLMEFTKKLKERGALPKRIEVSEVGSTVLANSFDTEPTEVISEFIFTGMDPDPSVAVLKSLVERVERYALTSGYKKGLSSCQTERSDGLAAYPKDIKSAKELARKNAFDEAIERFVWANWWDDPQFAHSMTVVDGSSLSPLSRNLLTQIEQHVAVEKLILVEPKIDSSMNVTVKLFFAFLKPFGVISGGACGTIKDQTATEYRALCELFRNAVAISRMNESDAKLTTFYERRLSFFGRSEDGHRLAVERLGFDGTKEIELPKLAIDEAIPHEFDDLVYVHRCYFENQPAFVGGKLERLCL